MSCDIIGLQETRRSGQSALLRAGYVVYCSGDSGGDGEGKKGQGGVGLAVRKSISRAEARPPEFISDSSNCAVEPELSRLLWDMHQQTLNLLEKRTLSGQPWKGS